VIFVQRPPIRRIEEVGSKVEIVYIGRGTMLIDREAREELPPPRVRVSKLISSAGAVVIDGQQGYLTKVLKSQVHGKTSSVWKKLFGI